MTQPDSAAFPSFVRDVYDGGAKDYDRLWTDHVRVPQTRLTAGLNLRPGDRVLDLACGSGAETVTMLRAAYPGEVVGVDVSSAMLAHAATRAAMLSLPLTTVRADALEFLRSHRGAPFDAVSIRFCLAYVDADRLLPAVNAILGRRGRIGLLTSLATSAPQARAVYTDLQRELGLPSVEPRTPRSAAALRSELARAGLEVHDLWHDTPRLEFPDGASAARWLWDSGYVAHPALQDVPAQVLQPLIDAFAERLDRNHPGGVVLDLELVGVIAARDRGERDFFDRVAE